MWRGDAGRGSISGAEQKRTRRYGIAGLSCRCGSCPDDACRRGRRAAYTREGGVRHLNVLTLLGCGILLAISFYLLGVLGAKSAPLYLAFGAVFLLALSAEPYFRAVQLLFDIPTNEETTSVAKTVCKALAIGYLVGIGADLCESLGAGALSKSLTFGGRVLIFSLGIPYLMRLIAIAREWLSL